MKRSLSASAVVRTNRRMWNRLAADWKVMVDNVGLGEGFFKRGGWTFDSVDIFDEWQAPPAARRRLDAFIRKTVGPVRGKRVLDLQCGQGEAALSWARLGANVTGIDASEERIALARKKAEALRAKVAYVNASVLKMPLRRGSFDLAYTGGGTAVWLPDLQRWAREVTRVLKPGGRLVVFEYHPFLHLIEWKRGRARLKGDYFHYRPRRFVEGKGPQVEARWRVMDYVNALSENGARLVRMEEIPVLRRMRRGTPNFPHRLLMVFRRK